MFGATFRKPKAVPVEKPNVHDISELEKELNDPGHAFTTHLSANELYLLRQTGFEPLQMVVGVIVYSMGLRGVMRSFLRAFSRGEMVDFSHFNQVARELAIARMQKEADKLSADGVVGVSFSATEFADFIEAVAIGTAVKRVGEPSKQEVVVGT